MTSTAQELLDRFAEIGASVLPGGEDRLVVRAGARPVPAALVRQLREVKAEILAALASDLEPQAGDAGDADAKPAAAAFLQSDHPPGAERLSVSHQSQGTHEEVLKAGKDADATYPLGLEPGYAGPKTVNSVSAVDALRVVSACGMKLSIDGDDLVLEASAPPPTFVLDLLSRHKADIMRLLLPRLDGWSAQDWQIFFDERFDICKMGGLVPREQAEARAFDWCVAEWLNRNSMCSAADSCFGCGGKEEYLDPLLPFGIAIGDRVWLHSRCQPAWNAGRKAEAISELANMGICVRSKPNGADVNAVEVLNIACVAGIKLSTDGNNLLLEPSASPPAAVLDLLSRHKADILALLLSGDAGGPPDDLQDFFGVHGGIAEPVPLLLSDGRRLHRFRADSIPENAPGFDVQALIEQSRLSGAVLVPDGYELIVVEKLPIGQMVEILSALRDNAGEIIAVLGHDSRSREKVRS
jgi:hypothetical protein